MCLLRNFLLIPVLSLASLREDTHKKSVFFSGRTTKGVGGGVTPPTTKQKTIMEKIHREAA